MKVGYTESVPLRVLVGWAEGISKNDAVDLAKGFIQRRFEAVDAGWYAISPFSGGYLWEAHEGGQGKAYLPAIIDALSQDPGGTHWFPSGDRAFQVMMRDGKPLCILLSMAESRSLIASGKQPLLPAGKMLRAVNKGTALLAIGGAMFGTGFAFLLGSMAFFGITARPGPEVRDIKFENLPLAQWPKVADTAVTEVVSKLEYANGKWNVEKRHHEIKELVPTASPPPGSVTPPQPPPATDQEGQSAAQSPSTSTAPKTPDGDRPAVNVESRPDPAPGPGGGPITDAAGSAPIPSAPAPAPAPDVHAAHPETPADVPAMASTPPSTGSGPARPRTEGQPKGAPRTERGSPAPEAQRIRKEPKPLVQAHGATR